jgi:hypothetical protein
MKFKIASLAMTATLLLAVTTSFAQTAASASVVPVRASAPLLAERVSAQNMLRDSSSHAPSTLDGLLMLTLGASLVAIQLRRRQKTYRAPLLRT